MEGGEGLSEQQLEAAREQVEQEIDLLSVDPLLSKIHRYLNNFEMWLPGGANRRFSEQLDHMDRTYREYYAEYGASVEDVGSKNSQLRLNQSDRQFYATIDRAIEEEGLPQEEIEAFNRRELPMTLTQFRQKILPLYIRLRAIGYTREDLHS